MHRVSDIKIYYIFLKEIYNFHKISFKEVSYNIHIFKSNYSYSVEIINNYSSYYYYFTVSSKSVYIKMIDLFGEIKLDDMIPYNNITGELFLEEFRSCMASAHNE